MRVKLLGVVVGFAILGAMGAAAQEHPNVAKGFSGAGGDIDSVSPFNGNLRSFWRPRVTPSTRVFHSG